MESKYYTVILEVSETHTRTLEIPEVDAKGEGDAVNVAKKMYMAGRSSHHFILIDEYVDDQYVVGATAKEDE